MTGVNKVILIGNLAAKPELKYTPSGVPVCNFRMATNERWGTDESGERRQHTEWHRIVAWRKLAEICAQYLDKGTKVYIEGALRTRSWTGNDNIQRWTTEIQADQMVILTPKGVREQAPEYPEDVPAMPAEPEGASSPAGDGSSEELGDTLNLDEDVDFF
jgi:single-strand DNA-binding protein